jgi:hypothetical protein
MDRFNTVLFVVLLSGTMIAGAAPPESLSPDLKAAVLKDAACATPGDAQGANTQNNDPALTAASIRAGGRELGTIVEVQGACHCQSSNCDTLVYLHNGQGYRLALHEKYASLHPMKIVKRGMPSLTGKFEVSSGKMETTVYDWDGKDYRPSLCATVTKGKKVPTIARHPCRGPAQ